MQRSSWMRSAAGIAALTLVLTACGGDDEPDPGGSPTGGATESPSASAAPVDVTGRGDGTLTIARVLPETGALDYLGGPMLAGVQLAIDDINAAGGVLDGDVSLLEFDSGTDPAVAGPNVNSALAQGADVIVGAAASGVTQSFLDVLNNNDVYNCSPSATSPAFNEQPNAAHFFKTVPPDEFVAPIIADTVAQDGNAGNVVIAARADDYGQGLAELVQAEIEELGGTAESLIYQFEGSPTFESEADQIIGSDPSAVVVIGFNEAATLIGRLVDGGVSTEILYGADGVFSSQLPSFVGGDPSVIDGMKVIGAAGTQDFNQRLADAGTNDFLYGAQAYDCTVLFALWAVAAGTDDTTQWDPQTVLDLTDGGEKCTSFEECKSMLEQGTEIDYDGGSGPIALAPGNPGGEGIIGNPSVTVYAIAQYQDGGTLTPVGSEEIEITQE